jgi:hypothetical protein
MADDLLVDGVSIESGLRHLQFDGWGDMFATSGVKGGNYDVPGRHGQVWHRKARDVGIVSCRFSIEPQGTDIDTLMTATNTEWLRILRMFPRRRTVNLTRVITIDEGNGPTVVRQTAPAELAEAIAPNWVTHSLQTGILTFRLLHGAWFDETYSTFNIPSGVSTFVPVSGSTDTATVVVDLTATAAGVQTLTNVSAGVSLSYAWTADRVGSVVRVDAGGFTVLRYPPASAPAVSSLASFSHSGDPRFMILDPDLGDNEFTLNTGAAVLNYRGAWL